MGLPRVTRKLTSFMWVYVGIKTSFSLGHPLKKVFPVQWMAKIVASRAAAKSFFFSLLLFFCKEIVKIKSNQFFFCKSEKKSLSALIYSPGRYTGNNIFLKDAPMKKKKRSWITSQKPSRMVNMKRKFVRLDHYFPIL